ncbi:hypothetical protein DID88_003459 [Monilinia fructigena]|uniref:Major facilitator superfamily (MFS) profile domain-containing protein n=1 Tax=Monilinia fructigena TaxID=38457 RepID=A0A395IUW2_9HELO|nr:hypothetical protein DID88_003459 [Monilinia fructigena]
MAGIHHVIGCDSAPVGGEKDVKDTLAQESRVVGSDADSTNSRAGFNMDDCGIFYTSAIQTRLSNALLVGSVIGILVLGYTSDKFSRKGGMLFTSTLVTIGSLLSTLAFQIHPSHNMLWFLTIARGIAGVGVGGEYPTSAAAALEGSTDHFNEKRGPIQVFYLDYDGHNGLSHLAESFPTAVRGLGYGVSAGFGKAGAAVGTQVFLPIQAAAGKRVHSL